MSVTRTTLGAAEAPGPFGIEGMALAWRLSVAAHALAGIEVVPRDMPVRVVLRSRSS